MSDPEQAKRVRLMRWVVEKLHTYWWVDRPLHDAFAVQSEDHSRAAHDSEVPERTSV